MLAFSVGTPQTPPTDDAFRNFADQVLPPGYDMGTYSAFRRLHFEASTLVVAQLKAKVTGDQEDGKQKLPVIEKQTKLADQKRRLGGVDIEGGVATLLSLGRRSQQHDRDELCAVDCAQ